MDSAGAPTASRSRTGSLIPPAYAISLWSTTPTVSIRTSNGSPTRKSGNRTRACRIGVLNVATGNTHWLEVPGDPRNHYIARMEWIDNETIMLQQLNRRQNTNRVMLGSPQTGKVVTLMTERDEA